MFGWLKLLYKNFTKLNLLVQILVVIIGIWIGNNLVNLLLYSYYSNVYLENFGNPKKFTYYYMEECGHCKKFSPIWDIFVRDYNGPLKLEKIERNNAGDDLEKYKIKGFPTILLIDDKGNKKEFNGDRTLEGLKNFISN